MAVGIERDEGTSTVVSVMLAGLLAVVALWSLDVLPTFIVSYTADRAAREIARGRQFSVPELVAFDNELVEISGGVACPGTLAWDHLMVTIALLDDVLQKTDLAAVDRWTERLQHVAAHAISCSPRDSAAWLALYWVEIRTFGLQERAIGFLRASYRFAPRESWISVRRNRLTLPIISSLPEDMRLLVLAEHRDLVKAGLAAEAAGIMALVTRPRREAIVAYLRDVPAKVLAQYKAELAGRGLIEEDATAPRKPARPWH